MENNDKRGLFIMATTTPKQFRVYPETAQAIEALKQKTGMGTADILKAMQQALEKVGTDKGRNTIKSRIETVQGHFMAVIAELEAMAQDLQAYHDSDLQKVKVLEEKSKEQADIIADKDMELAELRKQVAESEKLAKEWDKERQKLKGENERLKDTIMVKLEKL